MGAGEGLEDCLAKISRSGDRAVKSGDARRQAETRSEEDKVQKNPTKQCDIYALVESCSQCTLSIYVYFPWYSKWFSL